MTDNSGIFIEDLEWISQADLPWEKLEGSTVLVTGATGLIGMTAVHALLYANKKRNLGLRVCAVVRDPEKAVRVFGDLIGDRTGIFISHRLSSTKFCHKVAMFEDSRLVEFGTHDELMALKGKYYDLYETQAQLYREGGHDEN